MKTTVIVNGVDEDREVESIDITDRRKSPVINPVLRQGEELIRTLYGRLIVVKVRV